jgi:hypothetical protein
VTLFEQVLPSTELVMCKACDREGLPLLMPRRSAWRHRVVYHPDVADPEEPAVLEAAS